MVRPANQRAGAITLDTPKNGGAGDVQCAAFFDNRAIERFVLALIVFSKIDPQHLGLPL